MFKNSYIQISSTLNKRPNRNHKREFDLKQNRFNILFILKAVKISFLKIAITYLNYA